MLCNSIALQRPGHQKRHNIDIFKNIAQLYRTSAFPCSKTLCFLAMQLQKYIYLQWFCKCLSPTINTTPGAWKSSFLIISQTWCEACRNFMKSLAFLYFTCKFMTSEVLQTSYFSSASSFPLRLLPPKAIPRAASENILWLPNWPVSAPRPKNKFINKINLLIRVTGYIYMCIYITRNTD